jgi:hypothetical protein
VRTREKKSLEGMPIVLLHVLWKRGWIDEAQLDKYTIEVATDGDGKVLDGAEVWSLKCLALTLLAEEMTALQLVGTHLGVSVIITTKFHANWGRN